MHAWHENAEVIFRIFKDIPMFAEIKKESFDERELRILELWEKERIFQRSVEERRDRPLFSFYDGPPFATGLPHYGHFLAGTIKDVVCVIKQWKFLCSSPFWLGLSWFADRK